MKLFTPKRLRDFPKDPQGVTDKTDKTPGSTPFVSFVSEGQGSISEIAGVEPRAVKTCELTAITNKSTRPPLERLPHHLEALGRAASSGSLPGGAITLETDIVTDLTAFVFAWGWAYLNGASQDAITRLEAAHAAWTRLRDLN